MYKAIVVGTDGSDRAARAVHEALTVAEMSGATLHVVHVVRPVSSSMMAQEHVDPVAIATAVSDMRDEGDHICARVAADAKRAGIAAEIHNVEGDPADVLITVAEAVGADLVVVGNRGLSGVKRFVPGSVPNKVAHHCPCQPAHRQHRRHGVVDPGSSEEHGGQRLCRRRSPRCATQGGRRPSALRVATANLGMSVTAR